MCRRCVFVHRSSRLGAKVAVLDDEVLCGHGISATGALELAKAVHQCDGVMPHSLKSSRLCRYDSELKSRRNREQGWSVGVYFMEAVTLIRRVKSQEAMLPLISARSRVRAQFPKDGPSVSLGLMVYSLTLAWSSHKVLMQRSSRRLPGFPQTSQVRNDSSMAVSIRRQMSSFVWFT